LAQPSYLHKRELAWRLYVASGGLVSYLMALIRAATYLAIEQKQENLDAELLAQAFDLRLAGQRRHLSNPFRGEVPSTDVLLTILTNNGTNNDTAPINPNATNRRSKARGADKVALKNVLG
jgi:hypothetical protein